MAKWATEAPTKAEPLAIRAEFLLRTRGDLRLGLDLAREAVRLDPADDWNHWLVAQLAAATGDREAAAQAAHKALSLAPGQAIYEDFLRTL